MSKNRVKIALPHWQLCESTDLLTLPSVTSAVKKVSTNPWMQRLSSNKLKTNSVHPQPRRSRKKFKILTRESATDNSSFTFFKQLSTNRLSISLLASPLFIFKSHRAPRDLFFLFHSFFPFPTDLVSVRFFIPRPANNAIVASKLTAAFLPFGVNKNILIRLYGGC